MDDGARLMAVDPLHSQPVHELGITCCHFDAVHSGSHTVSADLPDICHTASVYLLPVCPLQASADRVG